MTFRAVVVPIAVWMGACATLNVSADYDPATDFSVYHTWAWGPADELPTGDPRLDHNPFFNQRVQEAVAANLAARGLRRVLPEEADLLVHYHASIERRVDVVSLDRERGYEMSAVPQLREWEQGTLMVDIAEAPSNRIVWRGWAQADIAGVIDHPDAMRQRIREACAKMFKRFPPPGTG